MSSRWLNKYNRPKLKNYDLDYCMKRRGGFIQKGKVLDKHLFYKYYISN
jgi:hypothetical protein